MTEQQRERRRARGAARILGFIALAVAGCGGAEPAPEGPRAAVGEAGAVRFEVTAETGPREGPNTFRVALRAVEDDAPLTGAAIQVQASMPGMGHSATGGSSAEELGGGDYLAEDVVLNMPGTWELHLAASTDAIRDEATFAFDVP